MQTKYIHKLYTLLMGLSRLNVHDVWYALSFWIIKFTSKPWKETFTNNIIMGEKEMESEKICHGIKTGTGGRGVEWSSPSRIIIGSKSKPLIIGIMKAGRGGGLTAECRLCVQRGSKYFYVTN